jgi:hypothetical protein
MRALAQSGSLCQTGTRWQGAGMGATRRQWHIREPEEILKNKTRGTRDLLQGRSHVSRQSNQRQESARRHSAAPLMVLVPEYRGGPLSLGMKYVVVTGGIISGLGKGITASSIGVLLKGCGWRVSAIKIDPYLNVDAGTMSPYEHGECYVLDDGGEVDLDLGNYERYLDVRAHLQNPCSRMQRATPDVQVSLSRDNNITTGKIFKEVIDKERRGEFNGKTVSVVPHVTNAIQVCALARARARACACVVCGMACVNTLPGACERAHAPEHAPVRACARACACVRVRAACMYTAACMHTCTRTGLDR